MGKKGRRHHNKKNKKENEDSFELENLNSQGEDSKKCPHLSKAVKLGVLQNHIPHAKLGQCSWCDGSQNDDTGVCICLRCGKQGCDRYSDDKHALGHHSDSPTHNITLHLQSMLVWCYGCDMELPIVPNTDLHECVKLVIKGLKLDSPNDHKITIPKLHGTTISLSKNPDVITPMNVKHKVKGLVNLGNTCFFNAVMQNLSQMELLHVAMAFVSQSEYSQRIMDRNNPITVQVTNPPGPLLVSLNKLLNEFRSSSSGPLNPKFLFSEICKKAPRFKGFQQQDSQELLRYLLDSVKTDQLKRVKIGVLKHFEVNEGVDIKTLPQEKKEKLKGYVQLVTAPCVDSIFAGKLDSIIVCHTCHKESRVTESFLDLSLSLVKPQEPKVRNKANKNVSVDGKKKHAVQEKQDTTKTPQTLSKHQQKVAKEAKRKKGRKKGKQRTLSRSSDCSQDVSQTTEYKNDDNDGNDGETSETENPTEEQDIGTDNNVNELNQKNNINAEIETVSALEEKDACENSDAINTNSVSEEKDKSKPDDEVHTISATDGKDLSKANQRIDTVLPTRDKEMTNSSNDFENVNVDQQRNFVLERQSEIQEDQGMKENPLSETTEENLNKTKKMFRQENREENTVLDKETSDIEIKWDKTYVLKGENSFVNSSDTENLSERSTKDVTNFRTCDELGSTKLQNLNKENSENTSINDDGNVEEKSKSYAFSKEENREKEKLNAGMEKSVIDEEKTELMSADENVDICRRQDILEEEKNISSSSSKEAFIGKILTNGEASLKEKSFEEIHIKSPLNYVENDKENRIDLKKNEENSTADRLNFQNIVKNGSKDFDRYEHYNDMKESSKDEQSFLLESNVLSQHHHLPAEATQNSTAFASPRQNLLGGKEGESVELQNEENNMLVQQNEERDINQAIDSEKEQNTPQISNSVLISDKSRSDSVETIAENLEKLDIKSAKSSEENSVACEVEKKNRVTIEQMDESSNSDNNVNGNDKCTSSRIEQNPTIKIENSTIEPNLEKLCHEIGDKEQCETKDNDCSTTSPTGSPHTPSPVAHNGDKDECTSTTPKVSTIGPPYDPSPGECSVQSCLEQFCSPEVLEGRNKFLCEECSKRQNDEEENSSSDESTKGATSAKPNKNVYTEASKQLLVSSTPPILTLHLKRFQQVGMGLKKVAKHVDFPFVLDLAPFCCAKTQIPVDSSKAVLYSLVGIVEHSGGLNSGHYTACIKLKDKPAHPPPPESTSIADLGSYIRNLWTKDNGAEYTHQEPGLGQWYYVSDSRVTMVTEEKVLRSQAYMLFYERLPLKRL